jgi:parallel beta-helix repeat protein
MYTRLRNSGTLLPLLALLPLAEGLYPATITVSPGGEISTLSAARDAARKLRETNSREPVTILIKTGNYRLSEPLTFNAADSNITWAAAPGEHPVISGGKVIDAWKKVRGNIWSARAAGDFHQLFINGRRAQRARSPNYGYYRIDGPSSQNKPFLLKYRGNEIHKSWEAQGDVEVIALLAWAEIRMPITQVDEATHTATLAGDPRPSNKEVDARYWIENAPDALDAPGEWYFDKKAGTVSYWPLPGEDLSHDEVVAPAIDHLVLIDGASNLTFRGLNFRHADWSIGPKGYADTQAAIQAPSAIEASGADHLAIEDCSFSELGGYAIYLGRGAKHGRIVANRIFDMGAGGIKIGETVTRTEAADQNYAHVISDNQIHNIGLVYPAAIGVWVAQSSRNTISHNDIHDLFYTAISVGWTWGYAPNQCNHNIIEFNHLYNIGKGVLSDMGAIYTLGVQEGTVIRNNLIHDVTSFTYGGWGIYPDEGSSNLVIENNIVYRTKSAGFHQHYGGDNVIRNNVFAFGSEYQLMRTRAEDHLSFTFDHNIIYFDCGHLLGGNWTGAQFRMNHNIYWDARQNTMRPAGKSWEDWKASGQDLDSLIVDPLFADPADGNFTPAPTSPAWKQGWIAIDMSTVGPRAKITDAVQ